MFTGIIESLGTLQSIRQDGTNKHFTVASPISHELKVDQSLSHNGVCLTVVALGPGTHTVTAVEETLIRSNLGALTVGDPINLERAMLAGARLDGHLVQGHVDGKGRCLAVEPRGGSWYFHFSYQPSPEHLLVDKGSICVNGVSLTVMVPPTSGRREMEESSSDRRSEMQVNSSDRRSEMQVNSSDRRSEVQVNSSDHTPSLVSAHGGRSEIQSAGSSDRRSEVLSVAIIPYTYEHTTFHRLKVGDEVNLEFDIIGKYIGRYLAVYGIADPRVAGKVY